MGSHQIQQYLQDLGRELLWEGIQADPELLKLARSPLFLTMLVIAYQGQPIRDTSSLFHAYIHKQLHEPSNQGTYKPGKEMPPEQTLHYLRWLSRQLKKRNETEFLIENLQPDWLENKQQQRTYKLLGGLFFGLFGGLLGGLSGGLGATILHFSLRICLTQKGYTPWNYSQFLEHAARHRFIQRTGGRYRFVHDLLRQHFAQMTQQQQAALTQKNER